MGDETRGAIASTSEPITAVFRLRMGMGDLHSSRYLIPGAHLLKIFADLGSEIMLRIDGDAGLLGAYKCVEFFAPVYVGEYLEMSALLLHKGKTSRKIEYKAFKYIQMSDTGPLSTSGRMLDPPLLVARAIGTGVVPSSS